MGVNEAKCAGPLSLVMSSSDERVQHEQLAEARFARERETPLGTHLHDQQFGGGGLARRPGQHHAGLGELGQEAAAERHVALGSPPPQRQQVRWRSR